MSVKKLVSLNPSDIHRLHDDPEVCVDDRVRTKTGRLGIVRSLSGNGSIGHVEWDDGDSFPIKCVHLEVLARNWSKDKDNDKT